MSNLFAKVDKLCTTENGALQPISTSNCCLDLFGKIGSCRLMAKMELADLFIKAYEEAPELAVRILLYSYDVRQGMGERHSFKFLVPTVFHLLENKPVAQRNIVNMIPELGRWDMLVDIVDQVEPKVQIMILEAIRDALSKENGLCAKWMPRQGKIASRIRGFISKGFTDSPKLTPAKYRKMLVGMSKTVEQALSARQFAFIEYAKVPSVATARYRKAFNKNDETRYKEYIEAVLAGKATINAGAIFPHDVIRNIAEAGQIAWTELQAMQAQWNALPNYLGEAMGDTLVMADVSGSMASATVSGCVDARQVAIGMAIYIAERNQGIFKNEIITFSDIPRFETLFPQSSITEKYEKILHNSNPYNTDLCLALKAIAHTILNKNLTQADMPKRLLIISDMQFDAPDLSKEWMSHHNSIKDYYKSLGFTLPEIIYWQVNATTEKGCPVSIDDTGVAIVSGYSPNILKSIFSGILDPVLLMMKAVMVDRYDFMLSKGA